MRCFLYSYANLWKKTGHGNLYILLLISLLQAINQFDPTIFHLFLYHDNIFENHKWIMIINKSCLYFRSHCSLIGVLSDFFVLWFLFTKLILVRFIPTITPVTLFQKSEVEQPLSQFRERILNPLYFFRIFGVFIIHWKIIIHS